MLSRIQGTTMNILRHKWLQRSLLGFGVFLILFGLFGYFALPGIIKSQAEKLVAEKLHRQLGIEKIAINPYTLRFDLHGVKLMEADGKTVFVSFEHLQVDVSAKSLLRLAPVVEEARLQKPYVHLTRTAANRYNFDDIVDSIARLPKPPEPPSPEPARFALHNLQLTDGRIEFDDGPVQARHVISDLSIGIPFISNLPSQVDIFVEPLLGAKVNAAPLLFKGKARPFADRREASIDLDFAAIDVTHYIDYLPFKPRFKLPTARLDIKLNASFRQDRDQPPALLLKGMIALKSLTLTDTDGKPMISLPGLSLVLDDLNVFSPRLEIARVLFDQPQFDIVKTADGSLNLALLAPPAAAADAAHEAATPAAEESQKASWQLALGEVAIRGGRFGYRDMHGARPLQAVADRFDLVVSGSEIDPGKLQIRIGTIASASAALSLVHGKPAARAAAARPDAQAEDGPDAPPPGYTLAIGKVDVSGWSARIEDHSLPKAALTNVTSIALAAENLSTSAAVPGRIDLKAAFNEKGRLSVVGPLGLAPLHADLALDLGHVDLMPLQPYLADRVNLLVTRAALSGKGQLRLDQVAEGAMLGSFKGGLGIDDLATVDKLSGNPFLRWKSLAFSGIEAQFSPFALDIDQIALNDFFARVIVDPSGRINLQNVVRSENEAETSLTEETATAGAGTAGSEGKLASAVVVADVPSKALPINIRKVVLKGGNVRFSDNFIKPNYTATLERLGGSVSGLSASEAKTATVDLHGSVNSAPLTIAGRINPLRKDLFLDIKAEVKGMELAPLSPYSGKYVGYDIEKGKLSFAVAYQMENRTLNAQNRIVLDQLTFGNKVESPTATSLPVNLAVALLRDRNGVIDINLPIGGSLDDPQFSVGGIIVKVLVNLITKAVTAPFALLGSLFGGGEQLSLLEFDPGRAVVPAAGESKLTTLAKALLDRPALKLEITGRFDPAGDSEGLRRIAVERKVKALKLKQLVARGKSVDMKTLVIKPEEYPVLLKKVYKDEDFDKPRNMVGLAKDLPVEEMEKLIMANTPVKDDDLLTLANRRAQAAKDWLSEKGEVPAERIFVIAGKSGAGDDSVKASASRVDFSLQ